MRQKFLEPSKECLSEALSEASLKTNGNSKIILEAMSKLVLEDDKPFLGLISKIQVRTELDKSEIRKFLLNIRDDEKIRNIVKMRIIADHTEEMI